MKFNLSNLFTGFVERPRGCSYEVESVSNHPPAKAGKGIHLVTDDMEAFGELLSSGTKSMRVRVRRGRKWEVLAVNLHRIQRLGELA